MAVNVQTCHFLVAVFHQYGLMHEMAGIHLPTLRCNRNSFNFVECKMCTY